MVSFLLEFCNKTFTQSKIQIIITSHSPFIASDLPNDHVIYLGRNDDKNPKTFAANIHDLLADSFFMQEGFVGEFAKKKIKEVISYLTDSKYNENSKEELLPNISNKKSYCKAIIDEVGEPLIRDQLNHLFNLKYPSKDDEIIKRLEEQIREKDKEIENLRKRKGNDLQQG